MATSRVVIVKRPLSRAHRRTIRLCALVLDHIARHQSVVVFPKRVTYMPNTTDGLSTIHNTDFLHSPTFIRSYRRGVQAAGWDYGIYWRIHVALWGASVAVGLDGDFVEFGTGRGMVMSAVLESLEWDGSGKHLWLFDSFSPQDTNSTTGLQDGATNPHYARDLNSVKQNFTEWQNIHFVPGRLPESLEGQDLGSIAFAHIDLNHYRAEVECLEKVWPNLVLGAIVLLDDYANRGLQPQYQAMNALARELGVTILSLPTGQGLICKT